MANVPLLLCQNDNYCTCVLCQCCCCCLGSSCGCGQALPVNKVTIVTDLNFKEIMYKSVTKTICIIQTEYSIKTGLSEEEVMFSAKDRNQIFDQSRDKEDGDNEHVVKYEDYDEDGKKCHHHHSIIVVVIVIIFTVK